MQETDQTRKEKEKKRKRVRTPLQASVDFYKAKTKNNGFLWHLRGATQQKRMSIALPRGHPGGAAGDTQSRMIG